MDRDAARLLCLRGTPVSPGLARGPLVLLDEAVRAGARGLNSAGDEAARLRTALEGARGDLQALMASIGGSEGETILAFQVGMLEDAVVTEPALVAIARGEAADTAWRAAMDAQIRGYHEAEDLYFRARASDLRDMRDRVLRHIAGESAAAIAPGSIVIATDLSPSRFLEIDWNGGGIALFEGSPNSHVAMLARARGVPMIVSLERASLLGHEEALLDTDNAVLVASPDAKTSADFRQRQQACELAKADDARYLAARALTAKGETVQVMINVADGSELEALDPAHCDGIGLVRTELLLRNLAELGDEEMQYRAYGRILKWANGKPVTFRTLDAGGDKPIAGYTIDGEGNPFLGVRGVRLSLLHPQVLTTQLRALARAAALGPLKVMVPMVANPRELDRVRALLDGAVAQLRKEGIECGFPELGMMVEVPAAALTIDLFDADFFSIGSNDLIQYITASSRDAGSLAALQDPLQPAVLRLVHEIVAHAVKHDVPVSLCGDMASDVRCIPALLGVGLRCLSVSPSALGPVKGAIARYRAGALEGAQPE